MDMKIKETVKINFNAFCFRTTRF